MPDYLTVIDANKFWDAPETDILPLPLVAVALGVGRNRMHQIPVTPIIIDKRKYYQKSAILDWALTDGGKSLLNELRGKKSSIRRYEKIKSDFHDYYLGFNGPDESKNKDAQIKRLYRELERYQWQLNRAYWPETVEIAKIGDLARDAFQRLTKLKRSKPSAFKHCWWVIDDPEKRSEALKAESRDSLIGEIKYYQSAAASGYSYIQGEHGMTLHEWNLHATKMIESLKADLKALD